MEDANTGHFLAPLAERDPLVAGALRSEAARQERQIELIASENTVSRACLEAIGSAITNKTVEGYPGRRFHGGAEFADVVEQAAIDRACRLFGCAYANVQPHSGTQANQAVFFSLLKPGARVLSMSLAAGGHLSHGAAPNQSGRFFDVTHYGVDPETERIDYDAVAALAAEVRPELVISGGSSYPRAIDFARMRAIADSVGARYLVDMAHFAGLVAGGAHPSPIAHADIVTCTTTKTLRGARGGLILAADPAFGPGLQSAVFPGVQGSIHLQTIAGKAVTLGEALEPSFRDYAHAVVANARALAAMLEGRGVRVVTGGSDTHLVLVDTASVGLSGQEAQDRIEAVGITSNKNPAPSDPPAPSQWTGLRLGTASGTTRGFGTAEFERIGALIADVLAGRDADAPRLVAELCSVFPLYAR